MIESPQGGLSALRYTDGEIAVNNLESARRSAWSRFQRERHRLKSVEYIVELEAFAAQFLGDLSALDRLDELANCVARGGSNSSAALLVKAAVASTLHRFSEAKEYLAGAAFTGDLEVVARRLSLSIDQARGENLESVLEARRQMAQASRRLEDLVPLGALLADLGLCDEADDVYEQAMCAYDNVSPFAPAWVCFQRGRLWGEVAAQPDKQRAARWYRSAVNYLPSYVKARVHLSEIYLTIGDARGAESVLAPVSSCSDPEIAWRQADILTAMRNTAEAAGRLEAARSGFEALLSKHLLAFADHGAEFYSGSGHEPGKAFELAKINLANRPTLRAFEQSYETAGAAGAFEAAGQILSAARIRWGGTLAFELSPLAAAKDKPGGRHDADRS